MISSMFIDHKEQFFAEHGNCVLVEGHYIFEDGAIVEDNPMGVLQEPPADNYERKQIIARYWQHVAVAAEEAFTELKLYLGGTGRRPDAVAKMFTDQERLEYLRKLQNTAKLAR